MKAIRKVFGKQRKLRCGFTTASLKGTYLSISHSGNMGNSILNVSENLKMIGLPGIDELKDTYFLVDEDGWPDYMYGVKFDISRDKVIPYEPATILLTEPKEGKWDNQYLKVPINIDGEEIGYTLENNPDFKTGVYIEDGMLEETNLLQCDELDMEGKRSVDTIGIFKVFPEHFEVRILETWDKEKHFYDYRLTKEGWDYLEASGLKHPGRGWVDYTLITKSDLSRKRNNTIKMIQNLQIEQFKLDELFF